MIDDKVTLSQDQVTSSCHKQLCSKFELMFLLSTNHESRINKGRDKQTDEHKDSFIPFNFVGQTKMYKTCPKKHLLTWFPAHCKTSHPLWTQRNKSPRNLLRVCFWHSSCTLWLVCNHTWKRLRFKFSIVQSLIPNRYWTTCNNVYFVASSLQYSSWKNNLQ